MEETADLLRRAHAAIVAGVFEAVHEVAPDLKPAHGNVMEQLDHTDGMRLVDLAHGAGMAPQSIGELVDQLEDLGYVERRPDRADRRVKRVFRTERSRVASAAAAEAAASAQADVESVLGSDRARELNQMLSDLIETIGSDGGDAPQT